jgi:uncharacterized low-complexity protein
MKKVTTIAVGTAFAATLSSGLVSAVENPFGMAQLEAGYQVAMSTMPEGACGSKDSEGKCGEKKKNEGKCGEGRCGGT